MTEAEALAKFVSGEISFEALRQALSQSIEFIVRPGGDILVRSTRPLPKTSVRIADIQRVLDRYRAGELTLGEVSTWGLLLNTLNAFELEEIHEVDELNELAQDDVWDIIGQLSIASLNASFDAKRVSEFQQRLRVNRRQRDRMSTAPPKA